MTGQRHEWPIGERSEAHIVISADHPSLPGHFPGQPVVPGVVLLERLIEIAQGIVGAPLRVTGIPQVKFLAPLLPDEPALAVLEWLQAAGSSDGGSAVAREQSAVLTSEQGSASAQAQDSAHGASLRFRIERAGQLIAQGAMSVASGSAH